MATTFKAVANEYIDKTEREGRAEATVAKSRWVLSLMDAAIGGRPIADIKPPEVLAVLKKMEKRGNLETARRSRAFASRVFRYAVATGRATADPAAPLQGALTAPVRKHHGAILDPKRVGELLRVSRYFKLTPPLDSPFMRHGYPPYGGCWFPADSAIPERWQSVFAGAGAGRCAFTRSKGSWGCTW